MSIGCRARKIAATRSAVCLGSMAGIGLSPFLAILMPGACPRHGPSLYGADGRDRSAASHLYRRPLALGGGDHVHHRLWRVVRVLEPAVSRHDAADRRGDAD